MIKVKVQYQFLFYFCWVLFFIACEQPDNTLRILEIPSGTDYNVSDHASSLKIAVSSDDDWEVTGATGWCVPNKVNGYGNDTLVLSITANLLQERTASLVVKNRDVRRAIQVIQKKATNEYLYKIPVVFHILYNDASDPKQNVDAGWIYKILDQVNAMYRGSDKSPNMGVEFVPATLDPGGNTLLEPGIDRVLSHTSIVMDCNEFMYDKNKLQYIWDLNEYINIMVYTFSNKNVLGISHLPYTVGSNSLSGLKNGDRYFIDPKVNYPHCLSLNNEFFLTEHPLLKNPDILYTLSHELGHYLGVFHVFSAIASPDDYCDDTPSYDRGAYEEWLYSLNEPLSFEELATRISLDGKTFVSDNIMDYDYSYLNHFTPDQHKRIRHVLENSPLIPGPKMADSRSRSSFSMDVPEVRTIQ